MTTASFRPRRVHVSELTPGFVVVVRLKPASLFARHGLCLQRIWAEDVPSWVDGLEASRRIYGAT